MNARQFVKQAIVKALEDAGGDLEDVEIATHQEPERPVEWVWIYRAVGKREPKVLGPQPVAKEEEIQIKLRVVAIRNDAVVAEERASTLADAVETAVGAISLGKPVLKPLIVKEVEDEPLAFDDKAGHHYLMTVSTQARI